MLYPCLPLPWHCRAGCLSHLAGLLLLVGHEPVA